MKRPSPALGVWTPVGRPEVGAKCSLFGPPRRAAGVSPQQTGLPGWPRDWQLGPQVPKDFPQSCSKLFPTARSLRFQSVASLGPQESPINDA